MPRSGGISRQMVARPNEYAAPLVADAAPQALLRLAVMLTGCREDGEDLLQSSLLRAARHGGRVAAMDAPTACLRTVVVREHASRGGAARAACRRCSA